MKVDSGRNEANAKLLSSIIQREKQERQASSTVTSEILSTLNVSIDALPLKCQQTLQRVAEAQAAMDIEQLDPIAISLHNSTQQMQQLNDEYEILKLKQKNVELQAKIDRNNAFLEGLRNELDCSRKSLDKQSPNPDNIHDHIRQLRQKLTSYEESWGKAKAKFAPLSVPDAILPRSLQTLVTRLASLQDEAITLKQRADDILLAREARATFSRLRR